MQNPMHSHRSRATITCLLVALTTTQAMANPPPWLNGDMVPGQSMDAIDQMHVEGQFNATPATYDSKTQHWSFSVMPLKGPRFDVTVDENTGDVCARYPDQGYCGGMSSMKKQIDEAKAEFARKEDARLNPAPEMDELRLMLIRRAQEGTTRNQTWYLSLENTDGKSVDPSPGFLARASSATVTLLPISTMPEATSGTSATRLIVGQPLRRPDGDYDVVYGVWSGGTAFLLGGTSTHLRMRHDRSGWHVVAVLGRDMI